MDTTKLKKFAQGARRQLLEQVSSRMEQVLRSDSVEIREKAISVAKLKAQIEKDGKIAVIDRVAYTWFNRFCALRFMDVNHYTRIGAVSPVEGGTQPEVLLEAKQGHVDEELARFVNPQVIFSLLNGQRPASDPQGEAYRLLLVGVCNSYSEVMPFLFEKIEDYTELLMPLDLLSENSVLHDLREALSPEACEDVEVIGWLYQYYISERKDKVFEALKQNQKIEAGDIPAATQLFTPHWIVRYLVENSLGRLWMLNHPTSKLTEKMEYYIENKDEGGMMKDEENPSTFIIHPSSFILISSPEEIKLLDPACGSGHILTYAFDLLAAIYEEEGYASSDIAKLILEKNIFGVEIDPRAGALAAFALVMKARAKDRRLFTRSGRDVSPNICVLENVTFNDAELKQYMNAVGRDLFTEPLMETLRQFEQADNFGSLIRPMLTDAGYVRGMLDALRENLGGDLFLFGVHERVLKVLKQAEFLAPRYHVVVANPPYMGSKGMNETLRDFARESYPDSKLDTFTMFIEHNLDLAIVGGFVGMITIPNWMFLSSFENLRNNILSKSVIISLIHNGRGVWGSDYGSCMFVFSKLNKDNHQGVYKRLFTKQGQVNHNEILIKRFLDHQKYPIYTATTKDLRKIPGVPIAFWLSQEIRQLFENNKISTYAVSGGRCKTHDDETYVRMVWEISQEKIGLEKKWKLYNKGGQAKKWYGNLDYLIDWSTDARSQYLAKGGLSNPNTWNRQGITWSGVTSSKTTYRLKIAESEYASVSPTIIVRQENVDIEFILGYLNTNISSFLMRIINPTVMVNVGDALKLPIRKIAETDLVINIVSRLTALAKTDWDSSETSRDFTTIPLVQKEHKRPALDSIYGNLRKYWQNMALEMQRLEEENNRIFIEAYGLQDELPIEIPREEITITCNPYHRYGTKKNDDELEALLKADTMKEFISYAVGCMFGRYSLDKPGLVLANQGEGLTEYVRQIEEYREEERMKDEGGMMNEEQENSSFIIHAERSSFAPDADNVIPVLDGEWFEDDIAERFKKFLRVTFGEEHYDENLAFIEEAIGRDVRSYFVKEFYKDHVQTYKKRPIYWMFSSPKGSFNALIYMHRYQPDTVSIVLNGYLREYIKKLSAHKSQLERTSVSGSASQSQKTKALKEITQVNKVLSELKEYEDDVLYPLATEQVKIDLDDGVKVNYGKFGAALSPIKGL